MENSTLLEFMGIAEKLKCNLRHSWTSAGRRESVAEHTYRLCMFAWLVRSEFQDLNMERVMELCLFHDLGEAVTGDIPCFEKIDEDRLTEIDAEKSLSAILPKEERNRVQEVFRELNENETKEAKLLHALDKMEALIQHNEADISTWLPLEHELQLSCGQEQAAVFPFTKELRRRIGQDSREKIAKEGSGFNKKAEAGFYVSKDPDRLSFERVVELMRQTYWAKNRSREMIKAAMDGSVCFGVYNETDFLVGFARIITDYATTFYLMDVIIDEAYRHKGLGKLLMNAVMEEVGHLHGVLHTDDAQEFYARYGFTRDRKRQDVLMEKERE